MKIIGRTIWMAGVTLALISSSWGQYYFQPIRAGRIELANIGAATSQTVTADNVFCWDGSSSRLDAEAGRTSLELGTAARATTTSTIADNNMLVVNWAIQEALAGKAPATFKTTLDVLSGLVKGDGAGNYSAVTDLSPAWNAAANVMHTATTLVQGTGANYLALSGQQLTTARIDLETSHITGILKIWHAPFSHSISSEDYGKLASVAAVYKAIAGLSADTFGLGTAATPTWAGATLSGEFPFLDINNSTCDTGTYYGIQLRSSASNGTPIIALGGTDSTFTHAILEDAGTFKVNDAGGTVLSHDGSTFTVAEPAYVSASSTAAFKVGSSSDLIVDSTNHKVGIGDSTPQFTLTMPNPGGSYNGLGWEFGSNEASRNWLLRPDYTAYGDFTIMTSSGKTGGLIDTVRLTIDPAGKVGIGAAAPRNKLDVRTGADYSYSGEIADFGVGTGTDRRLTIGRYFTSSPWVETMYLQGWYGASIGRNSIALNPAGGNVGIGIYNPEVKLKVNGRIYCTDDIHTSGSVVSSSMHSSDYYSSDGSQGITTTKSWYDADALVTHSVVIKNGLITSWTTE